MFLTASASHATPPKENTAMMVDGHFRHLLIVDDGRDLRTNSMCDLYGVGAASRLRHGALRRACGTTSTRPSRSATIHRMRAHRRRAAAASPA